MTTKEMLINCTNVIYQGLTLKASKSATEMMDQFKYSEIMVYNIKGLTEECKTVGVVGPEVYYKKVKQF